MALAVHGEVEGDDLEARRGRFAIEGEFHGETTATLCVDDALEDRNGDGAPDGYGHTKACDDGDLAACAPRGVLSGAARRGTGILSGGAACVCALLLLPVVD